jgi:hypothetical protein
MRSLQQLGDEIALLSVHLDAATVRLLDLIRGSTRARAGTMASALVPPGSRGACASTSAPRASGSASRALEELPRLKEAPAHGELSYAKVRALTRVATPETKEQLLAVGRAGTVDHVDRIVRGCRRVGRKEERQETNNRHKHRALHVYQDVDGPVVVRGRLAPEAGAVADLGPDRGR